LDASDYAFLDYKNEPIGIERCEVSNLIQKFRSGELEDQLYRCQDMFKSVILLEEGIYDEVDKLLATYKKGNTAYFRDFVYPRTQFTDIKELEVRLSEMGIEIIHSPNFICSIATIRLIHNLRTKPDDKRSMFKKVRVVHLPTKLTANPAVPRLMSLVPHLSEKAAIGLINKYDTIWAVLNAPDRELLEIEGVGKGTLANLKKSIGKP
jgi:ERCC4-type nuclease